MDVEKQQEKAASSNQILSAKQFELIRELVKSQMEMDAPLEYEDLDGYEVPPPTQFSMLKKPAISIKYGQITFGMACIRLFEGVEFILPLLNPTKKRFAVAMCKEEESASIAWARKKGDKWVNKSISAPDFVEDFFKIMNWNRKARYRVLGRVAMSSRGPILIFDLEEAIMFAEKPEEYIDPKTGNTKTRKIKYYPEQYRDRYGKTYSDYMASHPTDDFEPIEDYVQIGIAADTSPVSGNTSSTSIISEQSEINPDDGRDDYSPSALL